MVAQPVKCGICGQVKPADETMSGILVRSSIDALIRRKHPEWTINDSICTSCHNSFRTEYVMDQVQKDRGELSALEQEVINTIQAPIFMMSQNRQEARDRMRAENDYQVNLKAEIEIRELSEKMDQLLHHQWQRLLEIQRMQTEMFEDVARHTKG
jgi:hypothetical protein